MERLDQPSEPRATKSGRTLDRIAFVPLLEQLRELLADDDADAAEVIEKLRPLLATSEHTPLLAELERHVGEYDFEEALAKLDELFAELSLRL